MSIQYFSSYFLNLRDPMSLLGPFLKTFNTDLVMITDFQEHGESARVCE